MNLYHFPYFDQKKSAKKSYKFQRHSLLTALHEKKCNVHIYFFYNLSLISPGIRHQLWLGNFFYGIKAQHLSEIWFSILFVSLQCEFYAMIHTTYKSV